MTPTGSGPSGLARRRRARLGRRGGLRAVCCLALLVAAGCHESRRDENIGPGSPPTLLQPLVNQPTAGPTETLCGGSSPPSSAPPAALSPPVVGTAASGAALLDCAVVPLFPTAQARCPDRFETVEGTPCQFPLDNLHQNVAWTLTGSGALGLPKVLTIYVGSDSVRPVLRASDGGDPWAAVAVCPRDVNGDGLNDVVVTYRRASAVTELVVEAADVHTAPKETLNLQATEIPTSWPEGCLSPVVTGLYVEDGELHSTFDPRPFEDRPLP